MDQATRKRLERLESRHRALAARLAATGFITRGSVVQSTSTCGTPTCRCHTDPSLRHGPYWQWTRAVKGKTVTRRLRPDEARRFQQWVANRRRAEAILEQMEALTLKAAELLRAADRGDQAPRRGSARNSRPA